MMLIHTVSKLIKFRTDVKNYADSESDVGFSKNRFLHTNFWYYIVVSRTPNASMTLQITL